MRIAKTWSGVGERLYATCDIARSSLVKPSRRIRSRADVAAPALSQTTGSRLDLLGTVGW
jgi:hypothetical protein